VKRTFNFPNRSVHLDSLPIEYEDNEEENVNNTKNLRYKIACAAKSARKRKHSQHVHRGTTFPKTISA